MILRGKKSVEKLTNEDCEGIESLKTNQEKVGRNIQSCVAYAPNDVENIQICELVLHQVTLILQPGPPRNKVRL